MASAKTPATKSVRYRVLQGIDYFSTDTGKAARAEIGDVVTDIPGVDHDWLVEQGVIVDDSLPTAVPEMLVIDLVETTSVQDGE